MKKSIFLLTALILTFSLSVVAFADFVPMPSNPDSYDPDFIPSVPDFLSDCDGSLFGTSLKIEQHWSYNSVESTFWNNLYVTDPPYLVLLSQGVYNKYKEENNIDYDREYSVYFLKYKSKKAGSPYSFGSFSHFGGPRHRQVMNSGDTMEFLPLGNHFDVLVFHHDKERNVWVSSSLMQNTSMNIKFTYVLASSPIAGDPFTQGDFKMYPYHSEIKGKTFEVAGYAEGGAPDGNSYLCGRDYNWWLGVEGNIDPPVKPPYNPDDDLNKDTDGDGRPDINIDSDRDGRADVNVDTDGDGKPDINIDTDGDGQPDVNVDTNGDLKPDINIDTNGDGKPDINIDTNGDKKPDVNIDTNGDRKPDINIDTNGDGKPDINIDTNGDKKPDVNVDTNGDRKPDINIDTNGDGKPDINIDTDGDKKPDVNVDTNGDRKPDINIDTNGDGKPDTNIDTDGDGKPDVNIKPGGGSGGSGTPDSWWEGSGGSDSDLTYNAWEFFNPFKFMYEPFEWDNSFDPVAGYQLPTMPDFPGCGVPDVSIKDPFEIPNDIHFKDYVIEFGGK